MALGLRTGGAAVWSRTPSSKAFLVEPSEDTCPGHPLVLLYLLNEFCQYL